MPLAFKSISHGTVAFGFFNIESDMLLLDRYFFFCTAFCKYMGEIAACGLNESRQFPWHVHTILDPEKIGDLMGAIHGIHLTGFIGELYKKYPFPQKESEFKQKPEGFRNQDTVETIISKFAEPSSVDFAMNETQDEVAVGIYRFSRNSFQELIRYVWQGGYPRWENEQRPEYVLKMKEHIDQSQCALFHGLELSF